MLTARTTDYGLFFDWCPGNYNWRADRGRGTDVREWILTEVPAGVLSSGGLVRDSQKSSCCADRLYVHAHDA
jgi:hypothetical protein